MLSVVLGHSWVIVICDNVAVPLQAAWPPVPGQERLPVDLSERWLCQL